MPNLVDKTPLAYTSFFHRMFSSTMLPRGIGWLMLLEMLLTFHLVISTF